MIKKKSGVEGLDLRDIDILRRFDEEHPRDELEELGYDAQKGAFQARRVG